jgi:nitroreductase
MLWAAFGINRAESGKRTAPSALDWQETDIYVATEEGLYIYDAKAHMLNPVLAGDIRAETGHFIQPFVKDAPVNLIYVADYSKTGLLGRLMSAEERDMFSAAATGFISQNVYLFCASEGLATVVRGLVDRSGLRKVMNLRPEQKITLAQSVGYPEEKAARKTAPKEN